MHRARRPSRWPLLREDDDKATPFKPYNSTHPLDQHTFRKLQTYIMLHRNQIQTYIDHDSTSQETDKPRWLATCKTVGIESRESDRKAHKRRTMEGFFWCLPDMPECCARGPLVIKEGHRERWNSNSRKVVERMVEEVFDVLDVDQSKSISKQEWADYLTLDIKDEDPEGGKLLGRKVEELNSVKSMIKNELVAHQRLVCSLDMTADHVFHLVSKFMGQPPDRSRGIDEEMDEAPLVKELRKNQKLSVNEKLDDPHDEAKRITSFISMGRTQLIRFGLTHEEKCEIRNLLGVDEDNVDSNSQALFQYIERIAASIVSDDAWIHFQNVLEKEGPGEQETERILQLVQERRISEDEFKQAYKYATSTKIDGSRVGMCCTAHHIFAEINHRFNGEISKEVFFQNCMKGQTFGVEGLRYILNYVDYRIEKEKHELAFWAFLFFLALYSFYVQTDKGITNAYYQNLAIDEAVGRDEIGDPSSSFFAQTFYDTANAEEYYDWIKGPLLQTFFDEGGAPGTYQSLQWTNLLVGGLKIRQFRVEGGECAGQTDLLNHALDSCRPDGDPRKSTGWMAYNEEKTDPVPRYPYTTRTPCFDDTVMKNLTRSVKLAYLNFPHFEVGLEVLRLLIEEKLEVYVDFVNKGTNVRDAIEALRNREVDGVVDVWSVTHQDLISSVSAQKLGKLYDHVRMGIYMTKDAQSTCPRCQSFTYLNKPKIATGVFKNTVHTMTGLSTFPADVDKRFRDHNLTGYNVAQTVGYTAYDELIRELDEGGNKALFWSTNVLPLNADISPFRVALNTDGACSSPESTNMTHCDYPTEDPLKLVRYDLSADLPDVHELLYHATFTTEDMEFMLKKVGEERESSIKAACDWLKHEGTETRWDKWIRRNVLETTKVRQEQYYERCYPTWSLSEIDKVSFSHNAEYLEPGPGKTGNKAKKIYNVNDKGEKTEEELLEAPTREQYFQWIREAEGGNHESEQKWKNAQPWVYRECNEIGGDVALGQYIGETISVEHQRENYFGCSGYGTFIPISTTLTEATRQIDILKANDWIDVATRGVLVEFFVHNQNNRAFSRVQYMAEIGKGGGWVVSHRVNSFRLFQYDTQTLGRGGMVLYNFVILALISFFALETIQRVRRDWHKRKELLRWEASRAHGECFPPFVIKGCCRARGCIEGRGIHLIMPFFGVIFSEFWYLFDFMMWTLMYAAWGFRFYYYYLGSEDSNVLCTDVYPSEFETVSDLTSLLVQIDGITIIMVYLRLLYFARYDRDMNRITDTISRAASLIFFLLIIFFIVMLGFTLSAWVVFGSLLSEYRSAGKAFETLLFMMMGIFDFEQMNTSRPGFAMAFFLLFYIIVISILFNLLIGVIATSFDEVNSERVDLVTFRARVLHDVDTGSWNVLRSTSFKAAVESSVLYKETAYFFNSLRWYMGRCICENPVDPDYHNRNPRIFWAMYKKLLLRLESPDLSEVFSAHMIFKALADTYHCVQYESTQVSVEEEDGHYLRVKSVGEFIEEELGAARRPAIEFFCAELPTRMMKGNMAREWSTVLDHHRAWKLEVQRWAEFPEVDYINDAKESMVDVFDKLKELQAKVKTDIVSSPPPHPPGYKTVLVPEKDKDERRVSFHGLPEVETKTDKGEMDRKESLVTADALAAQYEDVMAREQGADDTKSDEP
eukprot:Sspe_Gene.41033::Locus_19833_Transcript_2_2_Confidence_0.500_Length_5176::g.41033::m.41033